MPLADCSVVNPFSNQILLVLSLIVSEHWLCSECMPVDSTQMTGDPSGGNMWWRFQLSYSDHVRPLCVIANFPQSRRVLRIPKKKNRHSTSSCSENHDASPYYVCRSSFFWGCFKVNILLSPWEGTLSFWTCKLLLEGLCFLLNTSERIRFSPSASDPPLYHITNRLRCEQRTTGNVGINVKVENTTHYSLLTIATWRAPLAQGAYSQKPPYITR
jgi:hypothetical protein